MSRRSYLLICLCITGCGGPQIPEEFTVSGKPIEYWLDAQSDSNPEVRARAVKALGNVGPEVPEIIPAMTKALTDSNADIRSQATLALLKFGPAAKEAVPALIEAQADKDENVRRLVAQALKRIEGQ